MSRIVLLAAEVVIAPRPVSTASVPTTLCRCGPHRASATNKFSSQYSKSSVPPTVTSLAT
ncbi:MAG: hypothetical protein M3370_10380 [Actinomycetota bacterium]|nr:hypothetical protein [Actinomycetota bacterium]